MTNLCISLNEVDDSVLSCIAHNTVITNLKSILLNGLALGGDGITKAVHSQLSTFHRHDARVQESSGVGRSNVVIIYNVGQTKPLLNVTVSGVLFTRRRIPSTFIERIWVLRNVPVTLRDRRCMMQKRWVTFADRRAMTMQITGWLAVIKSGYSDAFKDAIRKLNKHKGSTSFEDAFKQMGQNERFGRLLTRYCPQCGYILLVLQIVCLECGMVAAFESTTARSMHSVDYLKMVEVGALAITAGPAPRTAAAAADTVASSPTPVETTPLVAESKERTMAKFFGVWRCHCEHSRGPEADEPPLELTQNEPLLGHVSQAGDISDLTASAVIREVVLVVEYLHTNVIRRVLKSRLADKPWFV